VFSFKYSPRPNTPALKYADAIPDEEKSRRLILLQDKQRELQRQSYQRHIGHILEVMVEGRNEARGQWIGRTSQNKVLNFKAPEGKQLANGTYAPVLATGSFPNSLVGEMVLPVQDGQEIVNQPVLNLG
jgi:tRNA-2-methylthio-N6-dimethylallyladenosine synthase